MQREKSGWKHFLQRVRDPAVKLAEKPNPTSVRCAVGVWQLARRALDGGCVALLQQKIKEQKRLYCSTEYSRTSGGNKSRNVFVIYQKKTPLITVFEK